MSFNSDWRFDDSISKDFRIVTCFYVFDLVRSVLFIKTQRISEYQKTCITGQCLSSVSININDTKMFWLSLNMTEIIGELQNTMYRKNSREWRSTALICSPVNT